MYHHDVSNSSDDKCCIIWPSSLHSFVVDGVISMEKKYMWEYIYDIYVYITSIGHWILLVCSQTRPQFSPPYVHIILTKAYLFLP